MKYETKYNFGDKVYQIEREQVWERETCEQCDGEGVFKTVSGKEQRCRDCNGIGTIRVGKGTKHAVGELLTIGQIRVQHTIENEGVDEDDFIGSVRSSDGSGKTNFGVQDEEYKEEYMCYETGIGTGTVHKMEGLFLTKEDCQKKCDELNKKDGKNG
jgi:hypothetical protein